MESIIMLNLFCALALAIIAAQAIPSQSRVDAAFVSPITHAIGGK